MECFLYEGIAHLNSQLAFFVLTMGIFDSLLNLREQCLREMGFTDVFDEVKTSENEAALARYLETISEGDSLDEDKQLDYLTDNVLAGKYLTILKMCVI
jgi:hypothetical protein